MTDGWEVAEIIEDLKSMDGERWLITYKVPVEYAPSGIYSVSMPKAMGTAWAAEYGYDVSNEAEVDELLDHMLYIAPINEVLRKTGRGAEVLGNHFEMDPREARSVVKAQLEEFKAKNLIKQRPRTRMLLGSGTEEHEDPLEFLRQDMKNRIDKKHAVEYGQAIAETRQWISDNRLKKRSSHGQS